MNHPVNDHVSRASRTSSIAKRLATVILTAFVFLGGGGFTAGTAQAQQGCAADVPCMNASSAPTSYRATAFKVRGTWNARQSNAFIATFYIDYQDGTEISGTASHSGGSVRGTGEGYVSGNQFLYSVTWDNGTIGEYNGTFNQFGRLTGVTFDVNHPQSQATWVATRIFQRG